LVLPLRGVMRLRDREDCGEDDDVVHDIGARLKGPREAGAG
jgi:hypothetical protein